MRKAERRVDGASARAVAEGIRLYKALGYEYAIQHMLAQKIPNSLARSLLAVGFDRRERHRRVTSADEKL